MIATIGIITALVITLGAAVSVWALFSQLDRPKADDEVSVEEDQRLKSLRLTLFFCPDQHALEQIKHSLTLPDEEFVELR